MKSLSEIAETIQRETGAEGRELECLAEAVREAVKTIAPRRRVPNLQCGRCRAYVDERCPRVIIATVMPKQRKQERTVYLCWPCGSYVAAAHGMARAEGGSV